MRTNILMLAFFTIVIPVYGQSSRSMYFMNLPQSRFSNPAFAAGDSVYVGLPVLTGAGFSFNNNVIRYSDVILRDRTDSIFTFSHSSYDHGDLLARIKSNNSLQSDAIIQLLGIAIKRGKNLFFLDVNERAGLSTALPGTALRTAIVGTGPYVGERFDFSGINIDVLYFREFGIGYSRDLFDGFRAGIRGKFLHGIGSLSTDIRILDVLINQGSQMVEADMSMNVNAPLNIISNASGSVYRIEPDSERAVRSIFMRNGLNPGLSFDIGAVWSPRERIYLSIAATDIGFIRWRNDYSTFGVNEVFEFTGLNTKEALRGVRTVSEASEIVLDSLREIFDISYIRQPFTSLLLHTVNIGAGYELNRILTMGIMSQSRFNSAVLRQSVTLSANINVRDHLTASLTYTAANRGYDNIGAGIAARLGPVQAYLVTDRIPFNWDRIQVKEGNEIILPVNWNTFDLRLGVNLLYGGRKKKTACEFPYRADIKKRRKNRSGFFF